MKGIELKGLKTLQTLNRSYDKLQIDQNNQQSYFTLPIEKLSPGKFQPRKVFDANAIEDLATSIKTNGIIQPLIVRKIDPSSYEIIAGERRWRAAKIAGLELVPVIEQKVSDKSALAFALIENIQRENLNALEHALALENLKTEFSMTHDEIAEIIGCSRSKITNLLRLLSLSKEVKDLLLQDKLEMGHARSLLTLEGNEQIFVANKVIEKKLSVREVEKLIHKMKNQQENKTFLPELLLDTRKLKRDLSQKLSMEVKVNINTKGEGILAIRFTSQDELQWLIDKIMNL